MTPASIIELSKTDNTETKKYRRNKPEPRVYWGWFQKQANLDLIRQGLAICAGGNLSASPDLPQVRNFHWKQSRKFA